MESFEQAARLDYDHLVEVIPIAQTNRHGELTFTVTSIESYDSGFIAHFLFEHRGDDLLSLKNMKCVGDSIVDVRFPGSAGDDRVEGTKCGSPTASRRRSIPRRVS